jgi:signal transduction histidine kinase
MLDPRHPRQPAQPPSVSPPAPFVERRVAYRRADDQRLHEERVFLAKALDAVAADAPAEDRLAALLKLLARTAGARRAAVLADGDERRAAVAVTPGEDPTAAEALAAWLDATSDRSRAERAAAGPAQVWIVTTATDGVTGVAHKATPPATAAATTGTYSRVPVPRSAGIVLGFEFDSPGRAAKLDERLPSALARHAGVALAIVTTQLAAEREVATLRGRDAERSRFVSTVAHELRTPLTGLRGYLELILGDKVDDPAVQRDFLARSRAIVGSMSELVGDLLELSQLESGTLDLELEPFSVAEAAGHVAASLLPIAIERDIRLTTDLPARLRTATGDRRRVEQVVTNLTGNALKFTQPGGTVELIARFDGPIAVLVVRDDGRGIEPADRGRIFERFERLPGHESISGTGLGLPIARDLARRMFGDLDVASVPGSGSSFVLVLPGPAPVGEATVATTLASALAEEEQHLDERAVLRALASEGGARGAARSPSLTVLPGRGGRSATGDRPEAKSANDA